MRKKEKGKERTLGSKNRIARISARAISTACIALLALSIVFDVRCANAWPYAQYQGEGYPALHNKIVSNALQLLARDGYAYQNKTLYPFLEDVMNGVADADKGSSYHGARYGVSDDNQMDMRIYVPTQGYMDLGGFSHYFDAWEHKGHGWSEDLYKVTSAVIGGTAFIIAYCPFVWDLLQVSERYPFEVAARFDEWRNWQGNNAAEGARLNFRRAVEAWGNGDQDRAMYFLGYALHLIADACVPHHATHTILSGQASFESRVNNDLAQYPSYYEVDRPSHQSYLMNPDGTIDHGIYLSDLRRLSDGVYFGGDTSLLVDTEANIDALKYGHITDLSDPMYQFVDFAAHEASEWICYANDAWNEPIDLDNWWEAPNYIQTQDLRKKSPEVNMNSWLVFHYEGGQSITADFEWALDNAQSIDMLNWYSKELGCVYAYSGSSSQYFNGVVGGPWSYCLPYGPEPAADGTLIIDTTVYRGLNTADPTVDGWQLSQIGIYDSVARFELVEDPMWNTPYYLTSALEWRVLPMLDDPLPTPEPAYRVAGVHMVDIASKLCAGVINQFFNTVGLPRPESPMVTSLTNNGRWGAEPTYYDPFGNLWIAGLPYPSPSARMSLIVDKGDLVWIDGRWQIQGSGPSLRRTFWWVDNPYDWQEYDYDPGVYIYSIWDRVDIPNDGRPHKVTYYSEDTAGNVEPARTQTVTVDSTNPRIDISIGEPKKFVNDHTWQITRDTPITLTADDRGGSGVKNIYYGIYNEDLQKWMVGEPVWWHSYPLERYAYPFDFGGRAHLSLMVTEAHSLPVWRKLMLTPQVRFWDLFFFSTGNYTIHYIAEDNTGADLTHGLLMWRTVQVELVDSIEGFGVQIDPYGAKVQPGSSATYEISVRNRYETTETFDITLEGLDPYWFTLSQTSVVICPQQTANVTLTVSPPYAVLISKEYPFTVTATLQRAPEVRETVDTIVEVTYVPETLPTPAGGTAIVAPELVEVLPGTEVTINVQVVNNENFDDLIHVGIAADEMFEDYQATWLNWTSLTVFIPAGGTMTLPLKISAPPDASPSYKWFDVEATSMLTEATTSARVRIDNYLATALQELQDLKQEIHNMYEDGDLDQYKHDRIENDFCRTENDITMAKDCMNTIRHGFDDKAEGIYSIRSAVSRLEYLTKDLRNWAKYGHITNELADQIIQSLSNINTVLTSKAASEAEQEKNLAIAAIEDTEARGRNVSWLWNEISYVNQYLTQAENCKAKGWLSKAIDNYKAAFSYSQYTTTNAWHWSWNIPKEDWIDQLEQNQ